MNILEKIIEVKKEEVQQLRREFTLSNFTDKEFFAKNTMSLKKALSDSENISIIAEVKKASPSKGLISENFNHIEIAQTYFNNGAEAVSVLTDEQFFQGSSQYLADIAAFKTVPILRKDFIIDEYQLYQAKAIGADAVLLIAEALDDKQIKDLSSTAYNIGLEVLLEIHSAEQLDKIDFDLNTLIGINNRNLENFSVDLNTTLNLLKILPDHILTVSESGIHSREDIYQLRSASVNAVLVGEYLMRSDNTDESLRELKGWCRSAG